MDMPLQYSASMPLTPSRRHFSGMDIDYNTMLQATLNQQCMTTMSPVQATMMDQYASMPQDLQSSPFTMPTPSRSLPSSTPNHAVNMWPCNESPIMMFGNHGTPSPSPLQSMSMKRDHDSPSPPPSRSYRRRTMTEAQRRTMALQRHQSEMMYRSQHDSEAMAQLRSMKLDHHSGEDELDSVYVDRRVVPRPRERCDFMGCRKTYQKKEHLKRHQRAAHGIGGTPEMHTCPADGCHKVFKDRFDNFKQHLRIHKDGKSTRTPYNEEAAQMYDELCKQSKTRNTKKGLRTAKA
ncbi:C2H2 type master regulator of conidiophore development BrlA like protein [Verticillium longisporum]|uniref:C2H2 type master regulator of conidiophore development BrlA like protein n=1 Tax=Verticillium longisporum TaxID=100787 RepID=A0A8I3AFM0_VERLO|nr:C2H2 type master regulator of conidiophore development BrlA like protein [Verticillium longisporum]